jgi:hypothetical protein
VRVKKDSVVVGLRSRSAEGATAVELMRWLRSVNPPRSNDQFRLVVLLYHAFEIELDRLRPLAEWSGWNPKGALATSATFRRTCHT